MPSFMLLSQFAQSTYFFDLTALTKLCEVKIWNFRLRVLMCGFLLYIIGFGAVSIKLLLGGVKSCVLRQIMIMIGRILEKLSIIVTLEN